MKTTCLGMKTKSHFDTPLVGTAVPIIFEINMPGKWGLQWIKQEEFIFFEKTAWQIVKAFVLPRSHRAKQRTFPGSSAVEHSTVNRQVAGSNPARGAISSKELKWLCCTETCNGIAAKSHDIYRYP